MRYWDSDFGGSADGPRRLPGRDAVRRARHGGGTAGLPRTRHGAGAPARGGVRADAVARADRPVAGAVAGRAADDGLRDGFERRLRERRAVARAQLAPRVGAGGGAARNRTMT